MRSFITGEVKEYEMGGARSTHGIISSAYKSVVGKPEGKRSLG
jgi:hypothetical protein